MAFKIANRSREQTTSTGVLSVSAVVQLGGVTDTDLQTFVSSVGDGNQTFACFVNAAGDWQQSLVTVADASPDTLTIDTILDSSLAANAAITLSGTARVFGFIPADFSVLFDLLFGNTEGFVLTRGVSAWAAAEGGTDLDEISSTAGDMLRRSATEWDGVRPKYVVAASAPSTAAYGSSQVLFQHRFACGVTFPDDFAAYLGLVSQAGGSDVATGNPVFTIEKALSADPDDFTSVGSVTFATGTVTPTLATTAGALTFAQGDVLRVVAPVTPDTTFRGFYCTLVGFET